MTWRQGARIRRAGKPGGGFPGRVYPARQSFALFMRGAIVIFHKFVDKTLGEIPIDTGKLKTYTEEKIVTGSNGEKYEANHS